MYLSEESHFDVVLGRSFMEKRQIKTNPVDPTDIVCLDTGEKLDCELVILKDGKGEIVTVTWVDWFRRSIAKLWSSSVVLFSIQKCGTADLPCINIHYDSSRSYSLSSWWIQRFIHRCYCVIVLYSHVTLTASVVLSHNQIRSSKVDLCQPLDISLRTPTVLQSPVV